MTENINRRIRRLQEQNIEFRLLETQEKVKMGNCVREYSRLESTGWKGKAGTAVSESNPQGLFYKDLLETYSANSESIVYELTFNNKVVASQLALQRDETLTFLKMSYDENFKNFSPGFLLRKMILERLYQIKKIKRVEFYGRIRKGWTDKWTDEIRPMFHMNVFRNELVGLSEKLLKNLFREKSRKDRI